MAETDLGNWAVNRDAFNMLCGARIGSGSYRTVFACKLLPHLVVKVEDDELRQFANVSEMQLWDYAPEAVKRWLAPCEFLGPDGYLLLQRRTTPLPPEHPLPDRVPEFLRHDAKRANWGLLEGRLVCHDYASITWVHSAKMMRPNGGWID